MSNPSEANNARGVDTASITSETHPTNSSISSTQEMILQESNKIFEHLIKEMIETTGEYVKSEIDLCAADYKALEKMNKAVTERYRDVSKYTSSIGSEMQKLNESYANLTPMLAQIDDVEKCVSELEISAGKLDNYSKRLEAKYKQFTEKYLANK